MATVFEEIIEKVHAALDDEVPYGVFRLSQREHGALRRVIWIPSDYSQEAIRATNPYVDPDTGEKRTAMYAEHWDVECHITGISLEDAEDLREAIVYAVRSVMHTSSRPTGGTWVNQAMDEAQHMHGGAQKVIQRFEWDVMLLMPASTRVTLPIQTTPTIDDGTGVANPADLSEPIVMPLPEPTP